MCKKQKQQKILIHKSITYIQIFTIKIKHLKNNNLLKTRIIVIINNCSKIRKNSKHAQYLII